MDRMDDFMKKRLTDYSPSKDGWNIPSLELWDEAKEHFPKKEKSKKRFWTPFLVAGLSGALLIVYFYGKKHIDLDTASDKLTYVQSNEAQIQPVTSSTTEREGDQLKNENGVTSIQESKELKSTVENPTIKLQISALEANNLSKQIRETKKDQIPKTSDVISLGETKIINPRSESISSFNDPTLIVAENEPIQEEIITKDNSLVNQDKKEVGDKNIGTLAVEIAPMKHRAIRPLEGKNNLLSEVKKELLVLHTVPVRKSSFPKQEFGIGHAQIAFGGSRWGEINESNSTRQVASPGKYFNANLHFNRWLTPKWSLSTGIYYTTLNIDIEFSILDSLGSNELNQFVSDEFNAIINQRGSSITKSADEFEVDLIDGVELLDFDILNFQGDVGLSFKLIQLPLFLNYHIYKRRFEYSLGLGTSLDYRKAGRSEVDILLYNEGVLINKPAKQQADRETNFDMSLYTQAGIRYTLNKNINIGLTVRLNMTNSLLSGLEAGVYYRLYR